MRRKDREVVDNDKINEIISKCNCCRLGFNDDGRVYIVPLNFGFEVKNDERIFYFHSAKEGRKIDLIKKSKYCAFELDTNYELETANKACNYSAFFQSIIGEGSISIVDDIDDKKYALSKIMKHNTKKEDWDFDDKIVNAVCTFKLCITSISCKEHKKPDIK